jgi:hypothetical protein
MTFQEIDFCGIYLPPFFLYLLIAGLIYFPLHWYWDRIVIQRWVWNRPVFELAVFTILLAVITFIL